MLYGCGYKFVATQSNILLLVMISAYYLWDIPVLALYVHKIRWIKKKRVESVVSKGDKLKKDELVIIRRINYILTKVTILTILYEIFGAIAVIGIRVLDMNKVGQSILREFGVLIDSVAMMLIVHLMMEYNDNEYSKLLNILRRLKLCCCFELSEIGVMNDDGQNIYDNVEKDDQEHPSDLPTKYRKSIDTKTKSANALPVVHKFHSPSIDSVI